ncbi:hypothetical protein H5410_019989 [Solanum commersonii]|uniref:Uncharacterized protein n=1 Tax=Solanum commersonii TaxID=4109 RepID=A0A9J5ZB66_SOLCO|nr:hypothetical protein H5410_019989 [Solanum commersonii]
MSFLETKDQIFKIGQNVGKRRLSRWYPCLQLVSCMTKLEELLALHPLSVARSTEHKERKRALPMSTLRMLHWIHSYCIRSSSTSSLARLKELQPFMKFFSITLIVKPSKVSSWLAPISMGLVDEWSVCAYDSCESPGSCFLSRF